MKNVYTTKNIYEKLDLRIFFKIITVLEKTINLKRGEINSFQVFKVKDNILIHQSKKYYLKGKYNDMSIWAVQGKSKEKGNYWIIMFPEEY